MSTEAGSSRAEAAIPEFKQVLGHPGPLWMLFMSEFWERFAFYGIRWALVLYIVAQFHGGSTTGQAAANLTYGSYLALVYAGAIFGGYVADKIIGYQRSILHRAPSSWRRGLFMIAVPRPTLLQARPRHHHRAATACSSRSSRRMVGKLYAVADERRDSGFTIFYMGINCRRVPRAAPHRVARADTVFGTARRRPPTSTCSSPSGVGMLISLVWFYFGRAPAPGHRRPGAGARRARIACSYVAVGALVAIPVVYFLLAVGGNDPAVRPDRHVRRARRSC